MQHEIDLVHINFSEDSLTLLNLCLAFIMFGVALDIKVQDFRDIFKHPKLPLIGLLSQYAILPTLTILLILIFQPPPSMALGMVLLATCPGGNVSNFMVSLSGGNVALSVMLTAITTLAAVVVTPLAFTLWSGVLPQTSEMMKEIYVEPAQMIWTIFLLIGVPLVLGMLCYRYLPRVANALKRPLSMLSILIFLGFVIIAIAKDYENIVRYVHYVFLIVAIHNGTALFLAYWFARSLKLSEPDARAVSIETGIQNTALGLVIIFQFFDGLGGMAMVMAWWGIWHLLSGFTLSFFWKKKMPAPSTGEG